MINWMLEVEDIACPVDDKVDDMKTMDCLRSFVQRGVRGRTEGRENKVKGTI